MSLGRTGLTYRFINNNEALVLTAGVGYPKYRCG